MFLKVKNNFHMHTYRCNHAVGETIDYVKAASDGGAQAVGMSDHNPMPNGNWPGTRMCLEQMDDYFKSIDLAKQKYPKMRVLKAMECDYASDYQAFYEDELRGKYQCDYLIGALHHYQLKGEWYNVFEHVATNEDLTCVTDSLLKVMQSGLFDFIAHPDVFGHSFWNWNDHATACAKTILEAAVELDLPLEINGNGFRKARVPNTNRRTNLAYPLEEFWELAANYKVKVLINSDAHQPHRTLMFFDEAYQIVQRYNLNLIEDFSLYLKENKKIFST